MKERNHTRLKQLRKSMLMTQKEFCRLLGIKQNSISNIETGRAMLTERNLNILIERLGVNPSWLLGESDGPMYSDKAVCLSGPDGCLLEPVHNVHPRISWTCRDGSLEDLLKGGKTEGVEYLPEVSQFPLYDFTFEVKGDSMAPKFESGDEVACRWMRDGEDVQSGRTYLVETAKGVLMKRLYDEGDFFRCVSYNKEYRDVLVEKKDVKAVCAIVGAIRVCDF